ncbi:MAG: hypothetical protein ACI9CB_002581 [Rhodothermales bacterium]|jgi:hypothetical protein
MNKNGPGLLSKQAGHQHTSKFPTSVVGLPELALFSPFYAVISRVAGRGGRARIGDVFAVNGHESPRIDRHRGPR